MKNILRLFFHCLVTFAAIAAHANPDSTLSPGVNAFPFGINWLNTDHRLAGGNWANVMDSVCGFNTHHVGGIGGGSWDSTRDLNPPGWSTRSISKLIAADQTTLLYRCTLAERMRYEAVPRSTFVKPLLHFAFIDRDNATGHRPTTGPFTRYWVVDRDTSHTSHTFDADTVLRNNELFSDCNSWYRTWRDDKGTPFRVAVRMQVDSVAQADTDRSKNILSVNVIIHRYHRISDHDCLPVDHDTTFVVHTLNIPWRGFDSSNVDRVFFDSTCFRFPTPTRYLKGRFGNDGFSYTDSSNVVMTSEVSLEVHSKRYVGTRLLWITLEDSLAHDLMAGFDLDSENTTLHNKYAALRDTIIKEGHKIDTSLHGNLMSYYVSDESQVSEFATSGLVASILKDNCHHGTETERENFEETRYCAFVQPNSFRLPLDAVADVSLNP